MSKFKPGDVVIDATRDEPGYWGIIADAVRADGRPAFTACCFRGKWEIVNGLYTSGKVKLHPDPDSVHADFMRALLLGEVQQ